MTVDPACIFCKIVAGEISSRIVWEDDEHIAFLTRWPNTEGFTVLITKEHYSSYAFDLPDDVLAKLVLAAKRLGKIIDASFDDVGRTGMIFEGFGVNHIHAKLVPMHGTVGEWKQRASDNKKYFETYEGYISSHDAEEQPAAALDATAKRIRDAQK